MHPKKSRENFYIGAETSDCLRSIFRRLHYKGTSLSKKRVTEMRRENVGY